MVPLCLVSKIAILPRLYPPRAHDQLRDSNMFAMGGCRFKRLWRTDLQGFTGFGPDSGIASLDVGEGRKTSVLEAPQSKDKP